MTSTAQEIDDTPFESTHDALTYAYWCEAKKLGVNIMQSAPAKKKSRPRYYDRIRYMTEHEVITDGIMIKNAGLRAVDRELSSPYRWAIGITYRNRTFHSNYEGTVVPDNYNYLLDSELYAMAGEIMRKNPRIKHEKYVVYALKTHLGDRLKKWEQDEDWTKKTGRKDRTLRIWRNADNGIIKLYQHYYETAYSVIRAEYFAKGLINS